MKPAIVVIAYNRPKCLKRLMKSICDAYYPVSDIDLIISIDYSENFFEIKEVLKKVVWKYGHVHVRESKYNQGLKKHVLSCGDLSEEYGSVIVLEDDIVVSPGYYSYVLQMLKVYADKADICGISLYCHSWNGYANYQFVPQNNGYDVFLGQIGVSWGQCWTNSQWRNFKNWYKNNKDIEEFKDNDLPMQIDQWGDNSWAKYYYNYMVQMNKYYVMPYISLSTNFDDPGIHNRVQTSTYQVMLNESRDMIYRIPDFGKEIKYDMFFERILGKEVLISGIGGDRICFNLNGLHVDASDKEYIITTRKYEGIKKIASWGLKMRPIEQNVLKDIEGEGIYLYKSSDLQGKEILNYKITSNERISYELFGTPFKRLSDYVSNKMKKNNN